MSVKLKSVKDCERGNCMYHFPQFRRFTEEIFKKELTDVLDTNYTSRDFYHKSYPNWRQLDEEYRKILDMMPCKSREEFIEVCEVFNALQQSQNSFIRHNLYVALNGGGVAEFVPCCM